MRASITTFPFFKFTVVYKEVEVEDKNLARGQKVVRIRKVVLNNILILGFWHRIDVEDGFIIRKDGGVVKRWTKKKRTRWILSRKLGLISQVNLIRCLTVIERFVNQIRGRGSEFWVSGEESCASEDD